MNIYKRIDKIIIISIMSYLAIPIIMFLIFWFKWYISVPTILSLIFAVYFFLKNMKYKTDEEYRKIFNAKKGIILIILIILLNFLSGAGGLFYQNGDYHYRNAVLNDLIEHDWPVRYNFEEGTEESKILNSNEGIMGYYFTYWLPGALIGKISNFNIASLFMLFWQTVGVILFFYLICRKFNNIKIRYFIIFIMFSGLDIVGQLVLNKLGYTNVYVLGTAHIDTWDRLYCISSFITQLFWVFNQAIPAWIATLLVINDKQYKNFGIILALLIPYSPLPAVGLALIMFIYFIFGTDFNKFVDKYRFKEIFSLQNFLGVIAVIPIGLLFIQNENEKGLVFARALQTYEWSEIILFYVLFIVLEIGVYLVIINKENHKRLLTYVGIICALELVYMGKGGDFGNRCTIPALILVFIEVVTILNNLKINKNFNFKKLMPTILKRWRECLIIGVLLIAMFTNINECYRGIKFTYRNIKNNESNFANSIKTFDNFSENESSYLIKNFVVPLDDKKKLIQLILR